MTRFLWLALLCAACATVPVDPALYAAGSPQPASVALAYASVDATAAQAATGEAYTALALAQTQTYAAPTATAIALTLSADSALATRQADGATATRAVQQAQATLDAMGAANAAQATHNAAQLAQLEAAGQQAVIMTRVAGQAAAEASKFHALSVMWSVIGWGGSLAAVVVILGMALRVAGPALAHAGQMAAHRIQAQGNAYAEGRRADGDYALRSSQGWAAREVARQAASKAQQRSALPAPEKPPMLPEIAAAVDALKACKAVVGGSSRVLPSAREISGPVRAALEPLKGHGLVQVQKGRHGGLYLSRHETLDDLIDALERGYVALPQGRLNGKESAENVPL